MHTQHIQHLNNTKKHWNIQEIYIHCLVWGILNPNIIVHVYTTKKKRIYIQTLHFLRVYLRRDPGFFLNAWKSTTWVSETSWMYSAEIGDLWPFADLLPLIVRCWDCKVEEIWRYNVNYNMHRGNLNVKYVSSPLFFNSFFILQKICRRIWDALNPNRRDYYKIRLRKCIRCDCVITGTPKCARKCWPGSDTRWLGLPGHGAGMQEVGKSKPGGATTLLLTLFRVR